MNKRLIHALVPFAVVAACTPFADAQDMPLILSAPPFASRQTVTPSQEPGVVVRSGSGREMGFQFVAAEPAVSSQVVKGAPYSLEATVETEQTLADGNHIVHHQIVRVYRDSEGRTRREETLAAIGPWATSGNPPTIVTIQDPVSGTSYSLDPQKKIATRLPKGFPGPVTLRMGDDAEAAGPRPNASAPTEDAQPTEDAKPVRGGVTAFNSGAGVVMVQDGVASSMAKSDDTSESIGKDVISGVSADGTRVTTTIPAEAMGNERPIEITRERWYSPDLQIVLRSTQSDPRFGVTTYEVNKLDRSNPPRSLFEVPQGYQIRKLPEPPLPPTPLK